MSLQKASQSPPTEALPKLLAALLNGALHAPSTKSTSDVVSLDLKTQILALTAKNLAELFVLASFFASAAGPLIDLHWLQAHDESADQKSFELILNSAFENELKSLSFLSALFLSPTSRRLKKIKDAAQQVVSILGEYARRLPSSEEFRGFAKPALQKMLELTKLETKMCAEQRNTHKTVLMTPLYRAFDEMDRILGISYEADLGMRVDPAQNERLYEGAGLGVQSSYSTLLIALSELEPQLNERFIDLGSGYGRVGLVVGLLRPDLDFIGYEYVAHRVQLSQTCAERAGISSHVQFLEQDLSQADFTIPHAEVYYMYDPFSQETYRHVFEQLKQIGRKHPITVITKGRASDWLQEALHGENWHHDQSLDDGTMGFFRSPQADFKRRELKDGKHV